MPELIERNRRLFQRPNLTFVTLDASKDTPPPGDIVIVKQVLQHLSDDRVAAILANLRSYPIWIICDHTPIGDLAPNRDIKTGAGVRSEIGSGLVLTAPPFSIKPSHTELLSEIECYRGTPWHGHIRTLAYTF